MIISESSRATLDPEPETIGHRREIYCGDGERSKEAGARDLLRRRRGADHVVVEHTSEHHDKDQDGPRDFSARFVWKILLFIDGSSAKLRLFWCPHRRFSFCTKDVCRRRWPRGRDEKIVNLRPGEDSWKGMVLPITSSIPVEDRILPIVPSGEAGVGSSSTSTPSLEGWPSSGPSSSSTDHWIPRTVPETQRQAPQLHPSVGSFEPLRGLLLHGRTDAPHLPEETTSPANPSRTSGLRILSPQSRERLARHLSGHWQLGGVNAGACVPHPAADIQVSPPSLCRGCLTHVLLSVGTRQLVYRVQHQIVTKSQAAQTFKKTKCTKL